ncbi:Undecaprenyl-phosphate mannosyltransferase [Planctomycetes bacterium Pan216]|uniref:Undecaprenyl-phosphate mannosyltransferase n=1 Tax=Kolteria novifilia TaxID=2527975 RepID=A0A518AWZ4_9BACT|nr:Undecaprenyl-phosphate mannosyltransferase [Planctomycetes bacterium Pan216]
MPATDLESLDVGDRLSVSKNDDYQTLSVLMPVYNERWTLREIVNRVLSSPIEMEIELIIVDDGSSDGSWELIQRMAEEDSRIIAHQHEHNKGKACAIRTAIELMTGDIAVVQDADLEYDPAEYPRLLEPILDGRADAVFGSRFAGHPRRVLYFWHTMANKVLTLLSNMVNDLNLTDMETCYKVVKADILKQLRLRSHTFTFEPELTCRLSQWGARIYEVPISYAGRSYEEGKKIGPIDGVKALWEIVRCKYLDPQFTTHSGFYILTSVKRANGYNRWILDKLKSFFGQRVLEAGAGVGNLSTLLLKHERLMLMDYDDMYVGKLKERFGQRENVRIAQGDLTKSCDLEQWKEEEPDTVFCSNVIEHIDDDEGVLQSFHDTIAPGGHCIIVVPAEQRLYTVLDEELGHYRRYSKEELIEKMQDAGFEIAHAEQFNKLGSIGWFVSGKILRKRHLSPRQMIWFDRLLPVAKFLEKILPIPAMSLIVVGRKPAAQAQRMAA